ncbi:MAG: hypothetical protein JJE16_05975 [Nitrospiraceae bacterium]|nr:hypothetical protein [Nitrospiraceae bacterium]
MLTIVRYLLIDVHRDGVAPERFVCGGLADVLSAIAQGQAGCAATGSEVRARVRGRARLAKAAGRAAGQTSARSRSPLGVRRGREQSL